MSPASKVNDRNYKQASLEQYQHDILRIWPANMTQRPALYVWLHVVEHTTNACEGIRKNDWDTVLNELGVSFVWWLAFVGKLNRISTSSGDDVIFSIPFTPTDIIWNKYPRVCPVEFGLYAMKNRAASLKELAQKTIDIRCACLARKREIESRSIEDKLYARNKLREFASKIQKTKPGSLQGNERMIRSIFQNSIYTLSPQEIGFHLLEEIGEVSQVLSDLAMSKAAVLHAKNSNQRKDLFRKERIQYMLHLAEELADVFSWTVTLIDKIRLLLGSFDEYFRSLPSSGATLASVRRLLGHDADRVNICDIIWNKYGIYGELRCPKCRRTVCRCYTESQQLLVGEGISDWMREIIVESNRKGN